MKEDAVLECNSLVSESMPLRCYIIDYYANGGDGGRFFFEVKKGKYNSFDLHREFVSTYGIMIRVDEFLNCSKTVTFNDVQKWVHDKFNVKQLLSPKFSFYKAPISTTIPSKIISLNEVYSLIKGNVYKDVTEKLRSLHQKDQFRKFKSSYFDFVTFSGIFTRRHTKELLCSSNLIVIDIDHVNQIEEIRDKLLTCPIETELLFISPSGKGLKWVVRSDPCLQGHHDYFKTLSDFLKNEYGIECDKSGKDVSRACFLAHDPNVFINHKFL